MTIQFSRACSPWDEMIVIVRFLKVDLPSEQCTRHNHAQRFCSDVIHHDSLCLNSYISLCPYNTHGGRTSFTQQFCRICYFYSYFYMRSDISRSGTVHTDHVRTPGHNARITSARSILRYEDSLSRNYLQRSPSNCLYSVKLFP